MSRQFIQVVVVDRILGVGGVGERQKGESSVLFGYVRKFVFDQKTGE